MTPELLALSLAFLLQVAQLSWMALRGNLELGPGKTLSPRDRDRLGGNLEDLVSVRTARLFRAHRNHNEALILFTIAVVVVTLSGSASAFTAGCAWVYLAARILYVPAYYFGLVPWRSYVWAVGFLAPVLMILAALVA
jgi:uncharacterized MAPEG superfamily protein